MIRDITIGQYYPAESAIHKMDARLKLMITFVFIVTLFLVNTFVGYVFVIACMGLTIRASKVPFKFMTRGLKSIIIIILLFTKCSSSDEPTQKDSTVVTTAPVTEQQSATPVPIATPTPEPLPTPTPAPVAKEFIRENYGYVDYKELARNPDPYKGKSLTYSGKVIQVIEGDTETQHRIAVNGDYDNVIYVAYPKNIVTSRILDDDYVTVYGTSLGLYSYQSTMGGKITVPALYLDRIELQQ